MKTFAFGDVHGQYDELMLALECAGYEDEDRLIGLGDYIDYGSESREVIDFLCEAKRSNPNNIYVRGNHENQLLDAIERNSERSLYSWMDSLQGRTTLRSYGADVFDADDVEEYLRNVFPAEHLRFLEETPLYYDEQRYHFVHVLEFREGKITIYGHEHEHQPVVSYERIGLAIEGGVAVLDLDNLVICDDAGKEYVVDRTRLDGSYYRQK